MKIFNYTLKHGGGTFDARTLEPVEAGTVTASVRPYVVGGAQAVPEQKFDLDNPTTARRVEEYVKTLAERHNVAEVGTWIDDETHTVVVDAVDRYMSRNVALKFARDRGEQAIFDLVRVEEITV